MSSQHTTGSALETELRRRNSYFLAQALDAEERAPENAAMYRGYVLTDEEIAEHCSQELPEPGARVRLTAPVDRYPHFLAEPGLTGVVVDAQAEVIGGVYVVRMDEHLPGAEEWENCIIWDPDGSGDDDPRLDLVALKADELGRPDPAEAAQEEMRQAGPLDEDVRRLEDGTWQEYLHGRWWNWEERPLCSCEVADTGNGESGPRLSIVEADPKCARHGDPGETCACGQWPIEEYGPRCPSCDRAELMARTVAVAKEEILEDVRSGKVPATAQSFSELHDHVDANEYGGLCAPIPSLEGVALVAFVQDVQEALHHWIVDGGLRPELPPLHPEALTDEDVEAVGDLLQGQRLDGWGDDLELARVLWSHAYGAAEMAAEDESDLDSIRAEARRKVAAAVIALYYTA